MSTNRNINPYYATPCFAAKLYPRGALNPRTEAQLVIRDSRGTVEIQTLCAWYSSPNSQPRGIFLLVFNETNRVYHYFWRNSRTGTPYRSGSWSSIGLSQVFGNGEQYIYLTIDNRVTVSSRKVHIRYIQIYRDYKVTIIGVELEWTIEITDASWNPLYTTCAAGSSVTFNILNYILRNGMPLEGHIRVYTYNVTEFNTYGGWKILPGETRALTVSIDNISSGEYWVKVVTKNGVEYQYRITIP